ncbi:hypothetical protein DXA15_23480 [Parabacteroides sp. AM58-2XD]|nr:hypothetical protein DXA15_23480 [Parabacteroides sp. AM58-2XD]
MYKMNYLIRSAITILSICFFSCQENTNKNIISENIEIDIKQAQEKTLFTEYEYVKLETADNCLLPPSICQIGNS